MLCEMRVISGPHTTKDDEVGNGTMSQIQITNLEKVFMVGNVEFKALENVTLEIGEGEFTAIVGPSGSGKSTLLNMIAGIDRPTKGSVCVNGCIISDSSSEDRLARWRGENIGIIFQFFQLFPTLTALENVMIPMELVGRVDKKDRREKAIGYLHIVGLGNKLNNFPSQLSGGEQQRVAIARALANDPNIIIGDEPTGNLDSTTARRMFSLLKSLNDRGKTIVIVTHNKELASLARRRIVILDGKII